MFFYRVRGVFGQNFWLLNEKELPLQAVIGLWCNGNTADSGPAFPGSSPGSPTWHKREETTRSKAFCGFLIQDNRDYVSHWRRSEKPTNKWRRPLFGLPSDGPSVRGTTMTNKRRPQGVVFLRSFSLRGFNLSLCFTLRRFPSSFPR